MIEWFGALLRAHPDIAFFLALGIGFFIGRLRIGHFTLGSVTGVLLAGVLLGQLGVRVGGDVKQVFFLLFLFSIGYRTGPQFFHGLKSGGLAQAGLTVVVSVTALGVGMIVARLIGYDEGTGAGMLAGAMTESATIGTAGDALSRLPMEPERITALTNNIPVAFAVCYLIGVIAVAWFLSQIAPRLMRVDLAESCRALELEMSGGAALDPEMLSAWRAFELRAYRLPVGNRLVGQTVATVESQVKARLFIERIDRGGTIIEAAPDLTLEAGDVLAVAGRREVLVELVGPQATEVEDQALLDIPVEEIDVYVTSRQHAGRSIAELAAGEGARGVFLRCIRRHGQDLPLLPDTVIERGDIVTLLGSTKHVDAAAQALGYADKATATTDMVFVGFGVVFGSLIGLPAIIVGGLAIGLSQSVGALVGGLLFGWLRSVHPTFGRIPEATLWLFESLGLAGFIAVVGLQAGPDFVRGLEQSGPSLILAAIVVSLIPHIVGVLVGYYVFRMHPGIVLGVCAGAGTATPALAAIQEAAKSRIPTLGYGISYAVGNVLLALWGTVIVGLLH
ncbi:MAG TPA: aspartate-alanine antiporter [Alphaproteobacteria bacterium]|jgi:putative transport protein|nr:aspartate-alanine antiporter [Alphaproteobacteria bacterium]